MAKKKLTTEEKEEIKQEGELPKKSTRQNEEKQLFWFLVIIGLAFASFLVPYFYSQSARTFEYASANWTIEDYEGLTIFHGRFASFSNPNFFYNIYLRNDPRKNEVDTSGTFDKFKYGGVVSLSPDVNDCSGEVGRAIFDLSAFLRQGVGIKRLSPGVTDKKRSVEKDVRFATCETVKDQSIIILDMANESSVVQDEKNKHCYTIYIESCEDIAPVEKFMVKTISDLENKRINLNSSSQGEE